MVKTKVKCAGWSDLGRVRRNNEDAFYLDADRGIFLVVDGIGGQAAGEKAAAIALERVRARLERQTGTTEQRIREAIANANKEILAAARANPQWDGMACVLTVAVLENGSAVVGHVGDSRLYLMRRGEIRKITHDHSPVGEREDSGELTEAEAMRHPRRNEVFRDVGSEDHTPDDADFIELQRFPFDPDSAMLLCSDGLSDQVDSSGIRAIVERHAGDPDRAARELIAAANRAGGKDNVTVVLVEGEQFTSPESQNALAALPPRARGGLLAGRPAWFLYGLALAAGAAWFSRPLWIPPPTVIQPRVLTAGAGAPYSTIAAALAEAHAGDTVEVLVGDYREQIQLKSGVALRSRVPREAVLRSPAGNFPAVVAEGIHGARLAGFQIAGGPAASGPPPGAPPGVPLGPGAAAAVLLQNSQVELDDLDISGAAIGVEIRGGAPSLIGNSIHDCLAQGVLVTGNAAPWLSHNFIQRNKAAGLAAREGARPVLIDNFFEKNTVELAPGIPTDRNQFLNVPNPRGKK